MNFAGRGLALDQAGFDNVVSTLLVHAPEIWAVLDVETSGCGFLSDRRPTILFERHIFSRLTERAFDASHPDISNPVAGGYGAGGAAQYTRLDRAIALNRTAALESASWGIGQVMGFNAEAAGYANAEEMVDACVDSESNQLLMMAGFLSSNSLATPLRTRNWVAFARGYNGPNYFKNKYDHALSGAYSRYAGGPLPDLTIRGAQLYLTYLGYSPGPVDGWLGKLTRAAVAEFQEKASLDVTGDPDAATVAALLKTLE